MARRPACVLLIVALLLGSIIHCAKTKPVEGPFVVVTEGAVEIATMERREALAVSIAWRSLPVGEREKAAREWKRVADRIARRVNPLVVDLDDSGDLAEAVRKLLAAERPLVTAADSLLSGQWVAADRSFSARVVETCGAARGNGGPVCFPLFGPAGKDPLELRARFVIGPVAHAIRLRVAPSEFDRVLSGLRELVVQTNTSVALVITGRDERSGVDKSQRIAQEAARRITRLLKKWKPEDDSLWILGGFAEERPREPRISWLSLKDDEILVVPRLSALSRVPSFRGEVEAVLNRHVARPAPQQNQPRSR